MVSHDRLPIRLVLSQDFKPSNICSGNFRIEKRLVQIKYSTSGWKSFQIYTTSFAKIFNQYLKHPNTIPVRFQTKKSEHRKPSKIPTNNLSEDIKLVIRNINIILG